MKIIATICGPALYNWSKFPTNFFFQIKNNLLSRRARLSDLLRNENDLYESELKEINKSRRNSGMSPFVVL